MRVLQTIVFSLILAPVYGQLKTTDVPISGKGDNNWHQERVAKFSLPRLDTITSGVHYRIWDGGKVLDISENANGSKSGILTNWIDESISSEETPTNRTFVRKKIIDEDTVSLLMQFLVASEVLKLPTGDSIDGWKQGVDGIIYTIGQASKYYYSRKIYWTPTAQGSLKEAMQVQVFIDTIFSLVNAKYIRENFLKIVPFECTTLSGGMSVVCHVVTEKQHREYVKERRRYLKQLVKNK